MSTPLENPFAPPLPKKPFRKLIVNVSLTGEQRVGLEAMQRHYQLPTFSAVVKYGLNLAYEQMLAQLLDEAKEEEP